jgi:hypothetical protein
MADITMERTRTGIWPIVRNYERFGQLGSACGVAFPQLALSADLQCRTTHDHIASSSGEEPSPETFGAARTKHGLTSAP